MKSMSTTNDNDLDYFGFDSVNPDAQDKQKLSFPYVMWRRGDSKMEELGKEHFSYRGGFFATFEQIGADASIPGWTKGKFKGEKDSIEGLCASKAAIAIIRTRRRWIQEVGGQMKYRPWNQYEAGMKGQMQAIGLIKGFAHPVCFSFKGLTISDIEVAQRDHSSRVMGIVNRVAPQGKKLPPYALWSIIASGPHDMAGKGAQKSEVTPPRLVLPEAITIEQCRKLFIGKELLAFAQDLYMEAADWAAEWSQGGTAESENQTNFRELAGWQHGMPVGVTAQYAKATDGQIRQIEILCEQTGWGTPDAIWEFLKDSVSIDGINVAAAGYLIARLKTDGGAQGAPADDEIAF